MINLIKGQNNPCNCPALRNEVNILRDEIAALKKQITDDKYKEQEALHRAFQRSNSLYNTLKFSWEK